MSKQRNIFEDVIDDKPQGNLPKGGVIDSGKSGSRRAVSIWLAILFAMVALMVIIGGLTRLTDSGLSITEWKPITGAVPPMGAETWNAEFAKYQKSPEFLLQNSDMTLPEFKSIFWWEWGHRQLGRLVGLVWAVGFLFLLMTKRIPRGWHFRLIAVGLLGGLQGAVGWWMVSSGLTGRMVDVASYRLAIHLGLAFFILGVIAAYFWQMRRSDIDLMQARRSREGKLVTFATVISVLVFAQILLGALVAGIDAGRSFPEWPLMAGEFIPSTSFDLMPIWSNFFENAALVQFNHRILGYLVFVVAALGIWYSKRSPLKTTRKAFGMLMALVLLQVVLGVITVLYAAPWHAAIVHQIVAILVFTSALWCRFLASFPIAQNLR